MCENPKPDTPANKNIPKPDNNPANTFVSITPQR